MRWCSRALLLFVFTAMPQTSHLCGDEIEERIDKERTKHATVLERLDKTVMSRMEKAEKLARNNGAAADVQSIALQMERYKAFGLLPSFCDAAMFSQRSKSYDRLLETYRFAIRDYSKEKQDEQASKVQQEVDSIWPPFLNDANFGGWNPLGGTQVQIGNGVIALSGRGDKSAFLTTKDFNVREIMTVNMCASENTRAWVAIRVRDNQGKVSGYTSSILGNGDSVNVGKMGHDFDVKEIGVQSVVRKPNQFFEMKFAFDQSGAVTTIVDDRHNGGMLSSMEPNGKFGFFIAEGTLIIKSITVTQVP
jgi:hypothetical protein